MAIGWQRGKTATRAPAPGFSAVEGWWARRDHVTEWIYWGMHASCLLVFWVGASTADLVLLAATFYARMFGITGGYHRYFAHKSYKTSRAFQFVLAFLGASATQKGPLWWSGTHRRHHAFTDREGDPHSPREGFWYAHQGWVFDPDWGGTPRELIRDFARYPELEWLNRWHLVAPLALAALCYAVGGFAGLVWGYSVSTVLLWHATYSVNSFAHLFGTRRYDTADTSRNNPVVALLTFGEGWHNNHHAYQASARNGFRWWELDVTYYVLRALAAVGLVWELREPPASVLAAGSAAESIPRAA